MRRALIAIPLCSGCLVDLFGLDTTTVSCDLRTAGLEPREYCQEWRELLDNPGSVGGAEAICATLQADFAETPCPEPERIVGGCFIGVLGDGSESYWWFYDVDLDGNAVTADDVRADCEASGDEYVDWTEAPS